MPGLPVSAGNVLLAGLRTEFWNTYNVEYKGEAENVALCSNPDISSSTETEYFGYFETAAYPVIWPRDEEIRGKPFKSVQFSITNRSWGRRISFNEDDLVYDKTQSLMDMVRLAGRHFGTRDARVFFQCLSAGTDPDLLPSVPNAPDGAAMFATTAGGSNRFGVANGNALTGAYGNSTVEVRDGLFAAIGQAGRFLDPEGQPLHDPSVFSREIVIVAPMANLLYFMEAFYQPITAQAATTATSNAGVSNIILASGYKFRLWLTPRLTGNDWYVIFTGGNKMPFGKTVVTPLRENIETMDNSDTARRTKIMSFQADDRCGFYVGPAYSAVKLIDS